MKCCEHSTDTESTAFDVVKNAKKIIIITEINLALFQRDISPDKNFADTEMFAARERTNLKNDSKSC